jgi:hypothetical protein
MLEAVFIDGGYLTGVLRSLGLPRIDYHRIASWACGREELFRTSYYDCLPYQPPHPSEEERRRVSEAQRFFTALLR